MAHKVSFHSLSPCHKYSSFTSISSVVTAPVEGGRETNPTYARQVFIIINTSTLRRDTIKLRMRVGESRKEIKAGEGIKRKKGKFSTLAMDQYKCRFLYSFSFYWTIPRAALVLDQCALGWGQLQGRWMRWGRPCVRRLLGMGS